MDNKKLQNVNEARRFLDKMNEGITSPSTFLIGSIDKGYVYKECDPVEAYLINDVTQTKRAYHTMYESNRVRFTIKNVIFNNPATIVYWADGTKTVVKCSEDELFDPEKGLAMAITKRALGDRGNYFNVIKKWVERYQGPSREDQLSVSIKLDSGVFTKAICDGIEKPEEQSNINPRWYIHVTYYDSDGMVMARKVHPRSYSQKSSAVRRAKHFYADTGDLISWTVSTKKSVE